MSRPRARWLIADQREHEERADPIDRNDPTARMDPKLPRDPMDSTDPAEPIESTDPLLPMLRIESSDHRDHLERRLRAIGTILPRRYGALRG